MVLIADMEPGIRNQSSPRPKSSVNVPGLPDYSLLDGGKSTHETGTKNPPSKSRVEDFDITVNNLPEKIGFPPEFQAELEAVGGSVHMLAQWLLNSFNLDDKDSFKAGQLCSTSKQLEFYSKTLDAGPMVTRWLTTGYEIPFTRLPKKRLSAKNNRSCINNLDFAREELQRQVKCGVLSEVTERPLIVNPISCVFTNKWRLVVDCRLLNPYVAKRKIKLEDLRCVPAMVSKGAFMSTDDLEKGYW